MKALMSQHLSLDSLRNPSEPSLLAGGTSTLIAIWLTYQLWLSVPPFDSRNNEPPYLPYSVPCEYSAPAATAVYVLNIRS
jgi:hypothetical protein